MASPPLIKMVTEKGRAVTPETRTPERELKRDITNDTVMCFGIPNEDEEEENTFGHQVVVHESNLFRQIWNLVLACLLIHTGTIFPYKLCFMDFKVPEPIADTDDWIRLDIIVDSLFWVDLLLNFFFTYREGSKEIDDLRMIVKKYLTGFFTVNLIACMPAEAVSPIITAMLGDQGSSSAHKVARLARLQRITRLGRLVKLLRLARLLEFADNSPSLQWIRSLRGMRIINFTVSLFWVVHLLACGWYLCAALHEHPDGTWVGRRGLPDESSLLDKGPSDQWWHAMYFVLTIFTTVGFGDISAVTSGEIAYVCFVMVVGAVVHSVIVSEMINIVTSIDSVQAEAGRRKDLIGCFAEQTHLPDAIERFLKSWVDSQAEEGKLKKGYNREEMKQLVTSGVIPSDLLGMLRTHVFEGRLCKSKFLTVCLSHQQTLPVRLSVLVALELEPRNFTGAEVIYQLHDHPFNLFIVDKGTFAYVARAGHAGGLDEAPIEGLYTDAVMQIGEKMAAAQSRGIGGELPTMSFREQMASSISSRSSHFSRKFEVQSSKSSKTLDRSASARVSAISTARLSPYQVFGVGSYFGDLELLEPRARLCTARCESETGCLLVMHKHSFARVSEDFPRCWTAWRAAAVRREVFRRSLLRKHNHGRPVQEKALLVIQRFMKQKTDLTDASAGRGCNFASLAGRKGVIEDADAATKPASFGFKREKSKEVEKTVKEQIKAGIDEVKHDHLRSQGGRSLSSVDECTNAMENSAMDWQVQNEAPNDVLSGLEAVRRATQAQREACAAAEEAIREASIQLLVDQKAVQFEKQALAQERQELEELRRACEHSQSLPGQVTHPLDNIGA